MISHGLGALGGLLARGLNAIGIPVPAWLRSSDRTSRVALERRTVAVVESRVTSVGAERRRVVARGVAPAYAPSRRRPARVAIERRAASVARETRRAVTGSEARGATVARDSRTTVTATDPRAATVARERRTTRAR